MKAIYALVAACVSLQACIAQSETPTISTNINEYSSIVEYVGAVPLYDDHDYTAHEYTAAITTPPSIKPIDGAEFEGTSRDDAYTLWGTLPISPEIDDYIVNSSMDTADHTATVTLPAGTSSAANDDDNTASVTVDFYVSDERFDLDRTEKIDLHTLQAKDWW